MGLFDFFKDNSQQAVAPEPPAKVLVVDDDPELRAIYTDMLSRQGYTLISATNGQEAITTAKTEQPNTIVMDIMMPVMDGIEALRQLEEDPQTRTIPVIMPTNAGSIENMDKAKFHAAFKFFVKANVEPEELIKTVAEAIAESKRKKETQLAKG